MGSIIIFLNYSFYSLKTQSKRRTISNGMQGNSDISVFKPGPLGHKSLTVASEGTRNASGRTFPCRLVRALTSYTG